MEETVTTVKKSFNGNTMEVTTKSGSFNNADSFILNLFILNVNISDLIVYFISRFKLVKSHKISTKIKMNLKDN